MQQLSILPFARQPITIYNKYQYYNSTGKLLTKWVRRVIPNCFQNNQTQKITVGTVSIGSDATSVLIPLFDNYLDSYDWRMLPNDSLEDYFTVSAGDMIVIREVADEVDVNLGDIIEIENKYGDLAFTISNVNIRVGEGFPLQHIEAVS